MKVALSDADLLRQATEDAASALSEDIGSGDLAAVAAAATDRGEAQIVCRDKAVLCGKLWVEAVFTQLDPQMQFAWRCEEGDWMSPGQEVLQLTGYVRALLSGERTALNFLQTLSGTATAARSLRSGLEGELLLLDTRKTLPLLRVAQKYAVRIGGMRNHRLGLWDMAMLKENHLRAAGGMRRAVELVRQEYPEAALVLEVETVQQVSQALELGVGHLLLDNFSNEDIAAAVALVAGRAQLEVSGSVTGDRLQALAQLGVDFVSVGAVTKHLQAVDFSMLLLEAGTSD